MPCFDIVPVAPTAGHGQQTSTPAAAYILAYGLQRVAHGGNERGWGQVLNQLEHALEVALVRVRDERDERFPECRVVQLAVEVELFKCIIVAPLEVQDARDTPANDLPINKICINGTSCKRKVRTGYSKL